MAYIPKYSAVITVNANGTVTVKQYADSTQARLAYEDAQRAGLTCYYYYRPYKRKSTMDAVPLPLEFTI